MGMIYRRGNIYWIKYYKAGKPYRESSRSRKEADARRLLRKREGEIAQGKPPGIYFDRIRFEELAEDFLTDYRVNRRKSLKRAEQSLAHLKRVFDDWRVTSITTAGINGYIHMRQEEGAANGTINRELAALKRMLNLAIKSTPPKVAQVPHIPTLAEDNVRQGFFEHEEYLALRDALPEDLKGPVTLAYKTGWRVSEITGLTWKQVDLTDGTVRLEVGTTKNKEARVWYMDEEAREIFRALFLSRRLGCSYVFHRDGHKIQEFRKSWRAACRKAGIGDRLFHDFRRTAVRNMVRAGVPERVAMMISGHKTRSVFDRYNIVNDADLREATAKMEIYHQS